MRIERFDQGDLSGAEPALDLFFTGDGGADVAESLHVDEFAGALTGRKARDLMLLVLQDTSLDVVGDTGVEDAGCAGHDVDVVGPGVDRVHGDEGEKRGFPF